MWEKTCYRQIIRVFYFYFLILLQKGMTPAILPPAMGRIVGQTRLFHLGIATGLGEGKL